MQRRTANEVALTIAKGTEERLKAQGTRPGAGSRSRDRGAAQSRGLGSCVTAPPRGGYSSLEVLCAKS